MDAMRGNPLATGQSMRPTNDTPVTDGKKIVRPQTQTSVQKASDSTSTEVGGTRKKNKYRLISHYGGSHRLSVRLPEKGSTKNQITQIPSKVVVTSEQRPIPTESPDLPFNLEEFKKEYRQLKLKCQDVEQQMFRAHAEKESIGEELAQHKDESREALKQAVSLERESGQKKYQSAVDKFNQKLEKSKTKMTQLIDKLKEIETEKNKLTEQIRELKEQKKNDGEEIETLKSNVGSLREETINLKERLQKTHQEINKGQSELSEAELNNLKKELSKGYREKLNDAKKNLLEIKALHKKKLLQSKINSEKQSVVINSLNEQLSALTKQNKSLASIQKRLEETLITVTKSDNINTNNSSDSKPVSLFPVPDMPKFFKLTGTMYEILAGSKSGFALPTGSMSLSWEFNVMLTKILTPLYNENSNIAEKVVSSIFKENKCEHGQWNDSAMQALFIRISTTVNKDFVIVLARALKDGTTPLGYLFKPKELPKPIADMSNIKPTSKFNPIYLAYLQDIDTGTSSSGPLTTFFPIEHRTLPLHFPATEMNDRSFNQD